MFCRVHLCGSLIFVCVLHLRFFAEAFRNLILQGSLHFTWVFMGTRHIEAQRTGATIGKSEVGGQWDYQTIKEDGVG